MRRSNGAVERRVADDPHRHRRLAEQRVAGPAERHQLDVVAAPRERLGDLDGVHDPAARLDRVGEHRDPHATARRARRAAAALVGATITPAAAQRLRLAAGVLRVGVGAADVGDHRDARGELARAPRRGRRPGRRASRGRSRRRAARSRGRRARPPARGTRAAPRGRPSGAGGPACTPPRPGRRSRAAPSPWPALPPIGPSTGSRIVTASWASEPPEYRPSSVPPQRRASTCGLEVVDVRRLDAGRGERARVERRVDLERRVAAVPADERGDDALAADVDLAELLDDLARGRLGDQQERVGAVVGGEHPHRLAEHDPADRVRQVAPADADDLRDADLGAVEQARGLLRAGARPRRRCRRCRRARRWRTRARPCRASRCRSPGPSPAGRAPRRGA